MPNRRGAWIALLLGLLLAQAAWAQEDDADEGSYARTGPYLALGFSAGFLTVAENRLRNHTGGRYSSIDPMLGARFRAGFRLDTWLAVEADVEWQRTTDVSKAGGGHGNPRLDLLTVMGNVKFYPLTKALQPYLLLGAGSLRTFEKGIGTYEDTSDFAARFGGGLDYYVTTWLALGFEVSYLLPAEDVSQFDYVSLSAGATYRF